MTIDKALQTWLPLVTAEMRTRFAANSGTAAKLISETQRLFRYLSARGAHRWPDVTAALVLDWCWAAHRRGSGRHRRTAQSTARNRQWAAFAAFEAAAMLDAPIDPAALIGPRIARPADYVSARPLTDEEDQLARSHGDAGLVASRRSVMLAVSYASATAAEAAAVRMGDIDLDAGTVKLSGAAARVGPLDDWGIATVQRFVRNNPPIPPNGLLCVTAATSPSRAAHAVTVRLGQILRDAGIAGRPGVTARSIRLTTADRILKAQDIEAATRFLGSRSLDTTAEALGYRWGQQDG